jgi:hypothetical protein
VTEPNTFTCVTVPLGIDLLSVSISTGEWAEHDMSRYFP